MVNQSSVQSVEDTTVLKDDLLQPLNLCPLPYVPGFLKTLLQAPDETPKYLQEMDNIIPGSQWKHDIGQHVLHVSEVIWTMDDLKYNQ